MGEKEKRGSQRWVGSIVDSLVKGGKLYKKTEGKGRNTLLLVKNPCMKEENIPWLAWKGDSN